MKDGLTGKSNNGGLEMDRETQEQEDHPSAEEFLQEFDESGKLDDIKREHGPYMNFSQKVVEGIQTGIVGIFTETEEHKRGSERVGMMTVKWYLDEIVGEEVNAKTMSAKDLARFIEVVWKDMERYADFTVFNDLRRLEAYYKDETYAPDSYDRARIVHYCAEVCRQRKRDGLKNVTIEMSDGKRMRVFEYENEVKRYPEKAYLNQFSSFFVSNN